MQIFISWSGDTSKEIANAIKNWLPKVLQATKPYFTPQDIDKGEKWLENILTKLNVCQVGIICLTPENYDKPWILFEAGALANRTEKTLVCPILFNVNKADIKNPLTTVFQATEFKKGDFKMLVESINRALGESQVSQTVLDDTFEYFFPQLEKEVQAIFDRHSKNAQTTAITRGDRELLEEILDITRGLAKRNSNPLSLSDKFLTPSAHFATQEDQTTYWLQTLKNKLYGGGEGVSFAPPPPITAPPPPPDSDLDDEGFLVPPPPNS